MKIFSIEEKHQALKTLIRQSLLVKHSKKADLIAQIPSMPETAIDAFGKFLTEEVKHAKTFYKEKLPQLEKLLASLASQPAV